MQAEEKVRAEAAATRKAAEDAEKAAEAATTAAKLAKVQQHTERTEVKVKQAAAAERKSAEDARLAARKAMLLGGAAPSRAEPAVPTSPDLPPPPNPRQRQVAAAAGAAADYLSSDSESDIADEITDGLSSEDFSDDDF